MKDILRTVHFRPYRKGCGPTFTLRTFYDGSNPRDSRDRIAYRLTMREGRRRTVLFDASDFFPSPMHTLDSDAAVAALMGFLTLRPGDTDAEYFEEYTEDQRDFAEQHAEALSFEVLCRFGEV